MEPNRVSQIKSAGLGLRMPHFADLLQNRDEVPWLELLLDNWLCEAGLIAERLKILRDNFQITLHGVGLSLASSRPIDQDYLAIVKRLISETDALVYSEHLSFSETHDRFIPDLLPFPYTEQTLSHVADKIDLVQEALGRKILIENISAYIDFARSDYSEDEFIAELTARTGCGLLLDVNNMYVNQVNLGRDAATALEKLPLTAIEEIHLGGHEESNGMLIDAHNNRVSKDVWEIYENVIARIGPTATLIEWDNDLPPFLTLVEEMQRAQEILNHPNCTPSEDPAVVTTIAAADQYA